MPGILGALGLAQLISTAGRVVSLVIYRSLVLGSFRDLLRAPGPISTSTPFFFFRQVCRWLRYKIADSYAYDHTMWLKDEPQALARGYS